MASGSQVEVIGNGISTNSSLSVKFGTPEALEEARKMTDVGAVTRRLHEVNAYLRGVDLELDSILSQRVDLDRQLSSLQKASDVLLIVKADADHLLSNVSSTCQLADSISGKVRERDQAQSRVSDTLLHIDADVHRSQCLEGVQKALRSEDFESAANYVQTFLQIDAKFRNSAATKEREQLLAFKKQLQGIVTNRVTSAVEQLDHPTILRFVKLYPPLGLEEDGLQVYVKYLKKVISMRSRMQEMDQDPDQLQQIHSQVNFVARLTSLFKDVVLAVEENHEILTSFCGEDSIVYAICELQEECDKRASSIINKYMEYRKLAQLTSEINSYKAKLLSVSVGAQGPDPREIEVYLEEILSLTQLGEDYTDYMVSKIRALSSVDPELVPQATKAFRGGNLSRLLQDIMGYYVILEGYFMVENVRKAIQIDEHVPDSLTTSMVDDVFYVLQSCCRRSISTSNINSVVAVLSNAVSLLGSEYNDALQQKMRESNIGARLFLGGSAVQKTGVEITTALNDMDVSSEYAVKLRHEIEEQCAEVFPTPADRERIKSCLSELNEMSSNFNKALSVWMEQLLAAVAPRIRPVLDNVATISYELSEAEYADNEVNDPWVQRLLHAVEANVAWLQSLMTANNYDMFVHMVIDFIVKRLEVIMMQKRFSQLGGLQLDRDARALVTHFSSMTQRTVRDKFARLTQMATILNLEKVSEILDFWGENSGPMTWRLTPAEVRRVLGLRVDFKPEAIAALKL
ncbi:OLC1v1018466C1 [Oldenlandia corymbosa var. corymbosa]|uniref:Conserved oligomeric Golgi complex subunit 4 n=1 Tax=Oldenlandia corymbosa var. corymbosa TaxID=529605 RepID=A0AAV1EBP5_OLDCO|nr:OLC1v1018466C1 [Oldenlandia corymbosa var. corymbosa]